MMETSKLLSRDQQILDEINLKDSIDKYSHFLLKIQIKIFERDYIAKMSPKDQIRFRNLPKYKQLLKWYEESK